MGAAEAMRLETEKMCERSMVKTRDGMKRQLEDMNSARLREVAEARNKAGALGRCGGRGKERSSVDDLTFEWSVAVC